MQKNLIKQISAAGFTLIEMLLVLAIVAMLIYLGLGYYQQHLITSRIDKASLQMQQILNAGLAYYLANGKWPESLSDLQNANAPYLPSTIISPILGQQYVVYVNENQPSLLSVYLKIPASSGSNAVAESIAGKLPLSYTTTSNPDKKTPTKINNCTSGGNCYVVGQVNIPGQNLNNAMAVNYVGVYHPGDCVPAPNCPALSPNNQPMTPQIFVIPVSISGFQRGKNNVSQTLPIESFTPFVSQSSPSETPSACPGAVPDPACPTTSPQLNYWRVCLQLYTTESPGYLGSDNNTTSQWADYTTVAAFTRCAIANEAGGTSYTSATVPSPFAN